MTVATRLNDIPTYAETYGFRATTFGTIIGRSIMLEDLRRLLSVCPPTADAAEYMSKVLYGNALGKPTVSARRFGFRNMCEFYSLDRDVLIFRVLRDLWDADPDAQPMLALFCATARDPILRAVTPFVMGLEPRAVAIPSMISQEAERKFPGKFGANSLRSLGRNAASSWEQAGLLFGKREKERDQPLVSPTSVTYALFLGDLCGFRGRALFNTFWTRMLDAPEQVLREHAATASRRGWIEYRAAGGVVEVSFRYLMREILGDGK